jgi:type IV/VI secretion system ImpK/VasF family protein
MIQKALLESKINTPLVLFLQKAVYYCDKINTRIDNIIKAGEEKTVGLNELDKLVKEEAEFLKNSINELKADKRYASDDILNDALFATVALVDEIMTSKTWFGKEFWEWNTVEKQVFQSQASGEIFYQKIEKMLADRDYRYREVAYVYYVCLCLGFKGKYHDVHESATIEKIKTDLYNFYIEMFDNSLKDQNYPIFTRMVSKQKSAFDDMLLRKMKMKLLFYYNLFLVFLFCSVSFFIWNYFEGIVLSKIKEDTKTVRQGD